MTTTAAIASAHRPAGVVAAGNGRRHHHILIIGGGTAGISVAARLRRRGVTDIAVLEPSVAHSYQPFWTLVGAGLVRRGQSIRPERDVMPRGVHWIRDAAVELDPDHDRVRTKSGTSIGYDFLVIAAGIRIDWDAIPGMVEALGTPHVSSIYDPQLAEKMAGMIERFDGGTAVFSNPGTPIKCGGAPQKIMYLAADTWRRNGVLDRNHVIFGHAGAVMFGVPAFRTALERVVERYGIDVRFRHELVEIRPATREAVFQRLDEQGGTETIRYDLLHAVPRMSAPDFIRRSPLAVPDDPFGWADVDRYTLRSPHYPNVFALGDAAGTPNSKTGAAVRAQAPVLVENLHAVELGDEPTARYDGYASCPILTARNRMLLAEFDYDMKHAPSIPLLDTTKERYDMYLLKRYGLPWLYWNLMLKGRA